MSGKHCIGSTRSGLDYAAQQAVEDRRPRLVVTITASLSPVVMYHGLARRHLMPFRFLVRPLLNGGTLGGREHSHGAASLW